VAAAARAVRAGEIEIAVAGGKLLRRSGRYGLAAMCVGVGQGAALAFERA